ncbi:MAG: M56 family metallopeptidase, partial [Schlesneria sp.]
MDFESLLVEPTLEAVGAWNRMSLDALVWMAGSFSKALPLFVLVLIVTSIFRRWLAPSARHALWSLVLIRLMLPASVASPVSLQHIFSLANVSKLTAKDSLPDWLMFVSGQRESTNASPLIAENDTAGSPKPSLLRRLSPGLKISMKILLITGSTLMAIATVFAFWQAVGWARYSRQCTDPRSCDQLREAQRHFGIGTTIRLRSALQIGSAATFDWLWPMILVPENMEALPETQRTHLIWHEMARIKRHDSAKSLLLSVVRILHWWNPIYWWTQWQWKLERELACDRLAVQRLGEQQVADYQQTLTHFLEHPSKQPKPIIDPPGFVSFCDSSKTLGRRIQSLSHDTGPD